jgi:hypothetical protein
MNSDLSFLAPVRFDQDGPETLLRNVSFQDSSWVNAACPAIGWQCGKEIIFRRRIVLKEHAGFKGKRVSRKPGCCGALSLYPLPVDFIKANTCRHRNIQTKIIVHHWDSCEEIATFYGISP